LVATVDIMGVVVRKDVRDKLIIYAGTFSRRKQYKSVTVIGNCIHR